MSSTSATEELQQPMRHVAICAFPFGNHPATLLQLSRRIVASAPGDTSVVFTFISSATSNAKLFADGATVPDNIQPHAMPMPEGTPASEVDTFLEGGAETLRRSIEEAEAQVGVQIGCVVSDALLWFCHSIAEEKGVSWVPFWTAGPPSLSAYVSAHLFRTKFGTEGIEGKEHDSADLIPGFSSILAEDLPQGIVSGDLASPTCQMLHNMGLSIPKSAAVSINSFQELEPMINHDLKSKLPEILNVGPFQLTSPCPQNNSIDDHSCMAWLDQHNNKPSSIVYISSGTSTAPSKDDIKAIADALEAKGVPFLWSLRKESEHLLPDGFMETVNGKGKVVPWTPQLQVLGHPSVGVFVTHCGWNSVLESIVCGVPMICTPFFRDQMLTSKFIESVWKIGVRVEGGKLTKEGFEKAMGNVLTDEGKTIRENVQAIKKKAKEAAKNPNGSSMKDIEKLVEIVIGTSKKENKDTRNVAEPKQWRKWFRVFKVWRH